MFQLSLSQAYERAGNLEKALENYKAFHQVRTEVFDEAARATTHLLKVETEPRRSGSSERSGGFEMSNSRPRWNISRNRRANSFASVSATG